jgi:hypothetical protein
VFDDVRELIEHRRYLMDRHSYVPRHVQGWLHHWAGLLTTCAITACPVPYGSMHEKLVNASNDKRK